MTRDRVIRLSVGLVACGIFVPPLVTGLATVVSLVVAVTLGAVLAVIGVALLASRLLLRRWSSCSIDARLPCGSRSACWPSHRAFD